MIPLAAAVNGWFSVRLEREKYQSELRLKYVDRVLDSTKDPSYRESFLTYLIETTPPSDPLYKWGKSRLENAQQIIALRTQIATLNYRLAQITQELAGHLQDEKAATARDDRLQVDVTTALRQRLAAEEALSRAVTAGGYQKAQARPSEVPSPAQSYKQVGDGSKNDPKITSAICTRFSMVITGSKFGGKMGIVHVLGEPDKLSVSSWSDSAISVRGDFVECSYRVGSGQEVWVQTSDWRSSAPAEITLAGTM